LPPHTQGQANLIETEQHIGSPRVCAASAGRDLGVVSFAAEQYTPPARGGLQARGAGVRHVSDLDQRAGRALSDNFKQKPITTAPFDRDLELAVRPTHWREWQGSTYDLSFPFSSPVGRSAPLCDKTANISCGTPCGIAVQIGGFPRPNVGKGKAPPPVVTKG
jgi:hypothetical protein